MQAMRWKYYIPHMWESPQDRTTWEDIYLMPDDPSYQEHSIWLTIFGLQNEADLDEILSGWELTREEQNAADYWIKGGGAADMLIRAPNFNLEEFLGWVRVWLRYKGIDVTDLVAAPYEDFLGTNEHAEVIQALREAYPPETDNKVE